MRFKAWRNLSENYRRAVEGHSPWKFDDAAPQPVFISDVSKVELDAHLRWTVMAEGISALAFIPITYENRLLGKFMIYHNEPHSFTLEEIRPAQAVAGQIAFALARKRAEDELKRARDDAQQANRTKDDFLAALSHELRTPLNPALLIASECAANLILPPRVRMDFETIRKNIELEARLIDDLLDISRITCGKFAMEMDTVDIHSAICAALEKVQADLGQKEIA
jgi:signal transduction histidine kinase